MRTILIVFAVMFAGTAQASQYPLGSRIETEMKSFDPKKYEPGTFSFIRYMQEMQEFHDVGLHFNDMEIMLFDLPIPPDPQTQKAPQ